MRLRKHGYEVGLINEEQYNRYLNKINNIEKMTKELQNIKITPSKENLEKFNNLNTTPLKDGISAYNFLKRPEITLEKLRKENLIDIKYDKEIEEEVEINIKYEGYINKAIKEAEKMIKLENKKIPEDINYDNIKNIASEARQKLKEVMPTSIGQALRISGVNPADISILMVYLKKEYKNESK